MKSLSTNQAKNTLPEAIDYFVDTIQRSILFLDVLRERGNEYQHYENSGKPPILAFDFDVIMDGRTLPQPVNYALALIKPRGGTLATDPTKRPFVVIAPRAGHGPGIGGAKIDSEIGNALKSGHPCYFVMFYPQPEPGQTIACIADAERQLLQTVIERHPASSSKPFVIGNCQGGWALMIVAALNPDLVGPILLAGSPLAFWSGVSGSNPLRYLGGMLGGTWGASMASDLGDGKFDGAHLINNFEQLDPANTYWKKLYQLYANVDNERERFLDFERWWGGHFLLNKQEIEWITQKLFVGNRLSSGEIFDKHNVQVNLLNIRSPIIIFASWGDNITPPQQALNWIADLYDNTDQIRENEQTIVYFLHEKVGHLGLFASSGVASREHSELASALDLIDVLPPGLYEAIIEDRYPNMPGLQYVVGDYVIRFEPREVNDILALDDGRVDEQAFRVVRRVSQVNQAFYDSFISPFIRMASNDASAKLYRGLNPARLERRLISNENPLCTTLPVLAHAVRSNRKTISETNPFRRLEANLSTQIEAAFDAYRDLRDGFIESSFKLIYESPLTSTFVGFRPEWFNQEKVRVRTWEQREILRLKRAQHEKWFEEGTLESGFLRLLIYIASDTGVIDKRPFLAIQKVMGQFGSEQILNLGELKDVIKRETYLVRMDAERALQGLTKLLPEMAQRQSAIKLIRELLVMGGTITPEKEKRLTYASQVLNIASPDPMP